jgi:DNA-binding NarL/FixJ family response regulator
VATTNAPPTLRVSIGEDDVLLREGIVRNLNAAGLDVVAQVGDAEELVRRTIAYRPDVAIIDVQMPPRREDDGLLAAVELRQRLPDIGVLILSQYCEPAFAAHLIGDRPEGVGYLLKERVGDVATFTDAIRRVASGGSALDSEVVRRMMGRRAPGNALRSLTCGLESLIADITTPVDLEFSAPRLPTETETETYFIVAEALANVVKHAAASQARVRININALSLIVEVSDDGVGGADATRGSGLTGLRDRVDAAGGTLTIASDLGGSTTLWASLPVETAPA